MKPYRWNAVVVGALFVITMLLGMVDAYFVAPKLNVPLDRIYPIRNLIIAGAFSVFAMAVGIVGIAIALFPVVKKYSETIAVTYLSFRIIECFLLAVGPLAYLFLIAAGKTNMDTGVVSEGVGRFIPILATQVKYSAYQLGMILLGIGSMFLCYSFYKSRAIPRFLAAWGFIGYLLLLISALLDMMGMIDTINGVGALMYIPGGLWEFVAFPVWLFTKGFNVASGDERITS